MIDIMKERDKILDELYSSIKTGIVKQPWNC